jgi:4'-phosphopantetheinyl transferase
MLFIYQAKYEVIPEKEEFDKLLLELPEQLLERATRYKFKKDTYNFVLGRKLLKKGLENLGMLEHFDKITYQKNGKPILKNVFFNISHTENLVVCAISDEGEIGIDVEKVKTTELTDFKPWFSKTEWIEIYKTTSPIDRFFWYWTRKESIIKAMGVDLSYLHQIEVDASKDYFVEKGKKWHLKSLELGAEFCGALCSEFPITEPKFIKYSAPE